jgi:hypothetical protein
MNQVISDEETWRCMNCVSEEPLTLGIINEYSEYKHEQNMDSVTFIL